MLNRFLMFIHTMLASNWITQRHFLKQPTPLAYHHPLETTVFNTLTASPSGMFVHWGAYESGKSTAVRHAGVRLQAEGRFVILLHGFDQSYHKSTRNWFRQSVGVPDDDARPISAFFNQPTTIIIDHFESLVKLHEDTLDFLRELSGDSSISNRFNVLLVVTSWERAIELRDVVGCKVVGSPSRWTRDQLETLFSTLPDRDKYQGNKDELLRLATLSGTAGYLTFSVSTGRADSAHASIHDLEWRKGTAALDGGTTEVGRFPDKNGIFHHKDLKNIC